MSRRICAALAVMSLLLVLSPAGYGEQETTISMQQIAGFANDWIVHFLEEYTENAEIEKNEAEIEQHVVEPEESAVIATTAPKEDRVQEDGETEESNTADADNAAALPFEDSEKPEIAEEKPEAGSKADFGKKPEEKPVEGSEENVEEKPAEAIEEPKEMLEEDSEAETENGDAEITATPEVKNRDGSGISYLFVIGTIILLGAGSLIAITIVTQKKKKQQNTIQRTYQPVISADSDFITVLFLSGEKKGCMDVMLRKDRYLVGSSSECDFVLQGMGVDEKHACIYSRDGRQYIEDLDSDDGTYLDGMRLFSANRLRKNNVVTVGTNSFTVTF